MSRLLLTVALALAAGGCRQTAAPEAEAKDTQAQMPASESTTTLEPGATAPAFALTAADGTTVRLADAIADGPAVVVFYRGDW